MGPAVQPIITTPLFGGPVSAPNPLTTATFTKPAEPGAVSSFVDLDMDALYEALHPSAATLAAQERTPEVAVVPAPFPMSRGFRPGWKTAAAALAVLAAGIAWFAGRGEKEEAPEQGSRLVTGENPSTSGSAAQPPVTPPTPTTDPTAVVTDPATSQPAPAVVTSDPLQSQPTEVVPPTTVATPTPDTRPTERNPVMDELTRAMNQAPANQAPATKPSISELGASPVEASPAGAGPSTPPGIPPVATSSAGENATSAPLEAPVTTAPISPPVQQEVAPAAPVTAVPCCPEGQRMTPATPRSAGQQPAHTAPAKPTVEEDRRDEIAPPGRFINPVAPIEQRFFQIPTGSRPARLSDLMPDEEPVLPVTRNYLARSERAAVRTTEEVALADLLPSEQSGIRPTVVEDLRQRGVLAPVQETVQTAMALEDLLPEDENSDWLRASFQNIKTRAPGATYVRRRSEPREFASASVTTPPADQK